MNNQIATRKMLRLSLGLGAGLMCISAYAQSALGNWTGKMDFSGFKPKNATEQSQLEQAKKMFGSAQLHLSLKKDKTYTVSYPTPGGKAMTETGTWSQKGKVVTVTDRQNKPQAITLSANGKSMVMLPSANDKAPQGIKIVFTRA